MKKDLICLGIETTGNYLGITISKYKTQSQTVTPLKDYFKLKPFQQNELLIPTLDKLLKASHLTKNQLTLLAVNVGPGSFTGVRIGIAAARAISQFLEIPLVGVSALEVMAARAVEKTKIKTGLIFSMIPALAGDAYFAGYKIDKLGMHCIHQPAWARLEKLTALLLKEKSKPLFLTASKKEAYDSLIGKPKNITYWSVHNPPRSKALVALAISKYLRANKKSNFTYENAVPLYLQPSWAERKI